MADELKEMNKLGEEILQDVLGSEETVKDIFGNTKNIPNPLDSKPPDIFVELVEETK